MKRVRKIIVILLVFITALMPVNAYATGQGNIDTGGGGLGSGSDVNFWNTGDEGVRVTVVTADTGSAVAPSIDLTNRKPNDIVVHFGKVCKSQYRNGAGLSPYTSAYTYINPGQALPKIITTSSGSASLAQIKSYFTDEQVIRSIAGYVGVSYDIIVSGSYKLLLEPIAYVTYQGTRMAFTATEAAKYNQITGGNVRKKLTSLTHKNLPLAMFLETSDLGYPAWSGSKNDKVSDEQIISALGLGIVRFNEVVVPEVIEADYEYRVDTDVITAVTVSGGESSPDEPVTVTFNILGRNYTVNNVYYPEGNQQLVWVKWHTPDTEQHVTINVSVSGPGSPSRGTISANIVDLDKNPPPNPVADDRNDSYNAGNAVVPVNTEKTSASWTVWKPWWYEYWVWHSNWQWHSGHHSASCLPDCEESHGQWVDEGEYVDEGWWKYDLLGYSASLSADMELRTDEKSPTATDSTIKSGYGVNILVKADGTTSQSSATTPPQNAVSYFPEFYYQTYWRLLERMQDGYHAEFEFKNNHYSTYNRRTHFTPIWMPDGNYKVYTYLLDCWTPDGMLCVNLTDSVQISGDLWDDWHIAPQKAG
ncbi:MAG: hypothetical protein J6B94_09450 [Lachnospiraceae bacterium]|nr:hypothetical protein [Lachnospiraceae bacterium]